MQNQNPNPNILKITKTLTPVGTVTYPKKFGSVKFQLINLQMEIQNENIGYSNIVRHLSISPIDNINSRQSYISWCLDNKIMKPMII